MEETEGLSRTGAAFAKDWTKGSITRNLWSLSWPLIVTESLYTLGISIDMVWVGKLGTAPIAAIGIAGIFAGIIIMVMSGLSVGTRALIARFVGAGDLAGANHVARQALVIAVAYTVIMTTAGLWITKPILIFMGLEADVVAEGVVYMQIMFATVVTVGFWMTANTIMQASGDTVTPMKITIFYRCIHLVLCPFLVFGWWIFPTMGVAGAAWTNGISRGIGMILGLWVLFSGRSRLRLTLRNFRLDPNMIWRMVRIGVPACVMGAQRSLSMLWLAKLIVPFGTLAVAAQAVVQRVEMLLFPPCQGLGIASGVLVGQNLGAHQPRRAERSVWQAAGLAQGIMVVCSIAILVWAEEIVSIFNTEPNLVAMTSIFLRIGVTGFLMMGFSSVLMQSISGAGDTVPVMIFSIMTAWGVTIPLAYVLPSVGGLGVYGLRWALVIGMAAGAVASLIYFRTGRWKRKRV